MTEVDDACACARDLDVLYREVDKLYYSLARDCGLSDCAYWILYEIEVTGCSITQGQIAESFSYPKQTVNSALKSLEAKGLVELSFAEGSRKAKRVMLTESGRAFCDRHLRAAIEAETRAFLSLDARERAELARLTRRYARAIETEFSRTGDTGERGGTR